MPAKRPRNDAAPARAQAFAWPIPARTLRRDETHRVDIKPDAAARAAIAKLLGVSEIEALRLKGGVQPVGEDAWHAHGRLTARVVQPCVVTLAPVAQEIDEIVTRVYVPEETLTSGAEVDIDADDIDDDDPDGYGTDIDLGALLTESLSLALDPYPRAAGAELDRAEFAPPGIEPLSDEAVKPFAGLAALKAKLSGGGQ